MVDLATDNPPAPGPSIHTGQVLTVQIEDLAFGGEGVARVEDFVVFVAFTLPGETVEAEIYEVKKRFARGRLRKVAQASGERVTPECRYYGQCGGCQYQHLDYRAQLRLKQKQVVDILHRIGGFAEPPVDAPLPCPQPYGYRNRIMVRSQWDKIKQGLNIGFIRADCGLVVDVEECRIATPALNEQLRHARSHPPPKGGIKVLLRENPPGWHVPRDTFFQNNTFQLAALAQAVRERLRHSGVKYLIDAYCGVGFFSLELAGDVEAFVGVEYDRQAVVAAQRNLAERGVSNGEYVNGRTEDLLGALLQRFPAQQTAVLIDPPRTGCPGPSMHLLRGAGIQQVIYVSCHPATLARDLNILCREGVYALMKVIPVDMFPQTQHIECVVDLRRTTPSGGGSEKEAATPVKTGD